MNKTNSRFAMGLSMIWISHLLLDFMLGVWPVYKTIVQMDLVVAGLIASVSMFLGEGLQLYFGYLSDKGYSQKLLALGLGLTVMIPFLSYIENEWLLFAMVLCAFIGSGAFHPSGAGLITGNSERKSLMIALFACGGMIGASLSQVSYTFLYYHFAGHTWFLGLPILFWALGCVFFPFSTVEQKTQKASFKQILQMLKPQKFRLGLLYVTHILLQIVTLSFMFLLPDILLIKGYEQWFCLGGGHFYFIIGGALASIPIGYCVDKIGYRLVLASIVVASASLLYLFLGLETLSLTFPILILMLLGGTMGVFIPVVVSGGIQHVPLETRSFVSALYMGGTTCIAGFGPVVAGLLTSFFENQAPIIALQGLSSLLILALGCIYYLPDPLSQKDSPVLEIASNGEIP